MAEKKIHLRIVTPSTVKVDEETDMVILRCIDGDMGFMPDHEACSVILDYGLLRILNGKEDRKILVFGGFAEIKDNVLTVMTSDAEWPEEIDIALAEEYREHLERRLQEHTDELEIEHDQVLLRRALVRIDISASALVNKSDFE